MYLYKNETLLSPLFLLGHFQRSQRTDLPSEAFELGMGVLKEQLLLCLCLNKGETAEK